MTELFNKPPFHCDVDKMCASINSTLEDTSPSCDSGVQMLDSESSEVMIESLTSQSEYDDIKPKTLEAQAISIDSNSNMTSTDIPESIVYRQKGRKTNASSKAPKKRVSFHEDILKNTRTDNIRIDHGFITYTNNKRKLANESSGRYSWCVAGAGPTELCSVHNDSENRNGERQRRVVVYRNACSDVLGYGNSDTYDTNVLNCLQYDEKPGVFEENPLAGDEVKLCNCSCSSSNSSLDSDDIDKNSNQRYGQAKSSSCDCIGMSNTNNNNNSSVFIGDNCYFSEPNMDNLSERSCLKKSVWNKEKKPKSSCLKKSKCHTTHIIHEQNLNTRVKKFNVHDVNQLLDNSSRMLFGSLKSIFTMPLPERGVPEGSEDLQAVIECLPECEKTPEHKLRPDPTILKTKPFLSKSLDGSKQQSASKQFIHNVDEQLRRKKDEELAPAQQCSDEKVNIATSSNIKTLLPKEIMKQEDIAVVAEVKQQSSNVAASQFRSKFIVNCESTVFEHTGVSYETNVPFTDFLHNKPETSAVDMNASFAKPNKSNRSTLSAVPLVKTFSNFFRSFKDPPCASDANVTSLKKSFNEINIESEQQLQDTASFLAKKMQNQISTTPQLPTSSSSSGLSECSASTASITNEQHQQKNANASKANSSLALNANLEKQSRHLPSPSYRKQNACVGSLMQQTKYKNSPEHNNKANAIVEHLVMRDGTSDSKNSILCDDFNDDILTITTENDRSEDIVMLDYPDGQLSFYNNDYANLVKPPTASTAKVSLINRFLRNVTHKKILETSMRSNDFFASKLKSEQRCNMASNLYLAGVKPQNYELIDDLNAEIAMELEMSGVNSPRRELNVNLCNSDLPTDVFSSFELGIGEIPAEFFNRSCLHILQDPNEQLMKVFKLYTGYSREGFMTPVLVFLTERAVYVSDLVRNCLCVTFVLAYADLDVILMGPNGNTVLLSNSERDMQQVLLAGGPYPAEGLVANLELCARRSGAKLPAVGLLTIEHLAPLQCFVCDHSTVGKTDAWMYYAVVNVPAGTLGSEQEPLGPHVKGFLMHRRVRDLRNSKQNWSAGYFLLKAGVLYMFNDSTQKLPSWAMALAECQGARRAFKTGRPHCFEIVLRGHLLQLAAPDEYVASEWLQALLQSASGLFELQEKHKTLGCTLVITQNHIITLHEDFAMPLRQLNQNANGNGNCAQLEAATTQIDTAFLGCGSMVSSTSTPTKGSSLNSSPTKLSSSQMSYANTTSSSTINTNINCSKQIKAEIAPNDNISYSNMTSVYGKYAGLEILSCAAIKEMTGIRIPSHNDTWWCVLEFSCQEVRECSDDLVVFFSSSVEMQRFLRLLEQLWQAKNCDLFPITVLDEDDLVAEQCTLLYMDINRAWEPLLSAALGYSL